MEGILHKMSSRGPRYKIITDTDNKVKVRVVMDLLAKTIIMPPKIILNSEYLPRNLKGQ